MRWCHSDLVWVATAGRGWPRSATFPGSLRLGRWESCPFHQIHAATMLGVRTNVAAVASLQHRCPFQYSFSPAAPEKALVTQRTKIYKTFLILCMTATAKLCLPGASETRCSCAGVCLHLQNRAEVHPALGTTCLLTSQASHGLSAVQWHGFYSEFLPSLPKGIIALLQKPFVES